MATLTEVTYYLRKGLIFGTFFAIFATIAGIGIYVAVQNAKENVPIPTPSPKVSFGPLPKLSFPQSKAYPASFELLTIEGHPPPGTSSAQVYLVPKKSPTLFSRKEAEKFAQGLGFTGDPETVTDTVYTYTEPDTNSTLVLDTVTKNFTLKRNYIDISIFEDKPNTNETKLTQLTRQYFRNLGVWSDDLQNSTTTYFRYEGQTLVGASKPSDAQVTRVDYFVPSINNMPIITPFKFTSGVYLLFTASDQAITNILEASFQYYPPEPNNPSFVSTYPTTSGQDAWDKLVAGGAYIASPLSTGDKALIREIYLAYYQDVQYQPYLQPVWVFEGDNQFVAIVPAIDASWIGQ